jgi:hypothetical protein
MNRFEIGQCVKVKSSGIRVEIRAFKYEKAYSNGKLLESYRYFVKTHSGNFIWFDENLLELDLYTFDPKFEIKLLDVLIDAHLLNGQYDVVKKLNDEKNKLRGVK